MADAYTRQDVIETLMDPELNRIAIKAEGLWITGEAFRDVLTHILFNNISVEDGPQTIALYYSRQNKIVKQFGASPLTNEVPCYITQHFRSPTAAKHLSATVSAEEKGKNFFRKSEGQSARFEANLRVKDELQTRIRRDWR